MLGELFLIGSLWFWLLLAVELVVLICLVDNEEGFWATGSVAAFLALLYYFGDLTVVVEYAARHPVHIAVAVAAYCAAGAIWSVIKWWLYVKDKFDDYRLASDRWLIGKQSQPGSVPKSLREQWADYLSKSPSLARVPSVAENKRTIVRWISFWPVSVVWTCINDFVRRLAVAVYDAIADFLQGIANRTFAGVRKDTVND